jgi:hypothetical protein
MMRQLLTTFFSSADNLEPPYDTKPWASDTTTGILIEDALVWRPELTGKRPAIIIKRNDWSSIKIGTFGNVSGLTSDGNRQYTKHWKGSHTCFCLAVEGAEAELLGAEVYRYFLHFGQAIRETFALSMFELLQVGAPARVEEAKDHYAVPVSVGYGWEETWVLRQTTPTIKAVSLSTTQVLGS